MLTRRGSEMKVVAAARHLHPEALRLQVGLKAGRRVERQVLLIDLAVVAAIVMPAMTGVDHHRAEILRLRRSQHQHARQDATTGPEPMSQGFH